MYPRLETSGKVGGNADQARVDTFYFERSIAGSAPTSMSVSTIVYKPPGAK